MKTDLKKFIKECDVCQRIKFETFAPASFLQPLAIPPTAWADMSLDFVEGLPTSQGFEVILVMVYWLTKYAYLCLCLTLTLLLRLLPYTSSTYSNSMACLPLL